MNNTIKRALSALLCLAMVIGFVPLIPAQAEAAQSGTDAQTAGQNYVSLPITIRDFAADGMLFEFNQLGDPDEYYVAGTTEYAGLKAYFAEAPEVDIYDTTQFADGANKKQMNGYVRYYPCDEGLKLSFRMKDLNDGANFTRGDADWVVIKFRTSKTYSTTNYPEINGYSEPFIAHRGPDGTEADPYGSSLKLYNNNRTLSSVGNRFDDIETNWKDMLGTAGDGGTKEWQYTKVHLSGGDTEITYISMYINQVQGHVDFGGIWIFDSNDNAKAFIANDYQYETAEFYNGDNKGYGLLETDDNDKYNCLPRNGNAIAGSEFVENGSYSDTTEPAGQKQTLNSGATQYVHGGIIRTNLVEAKLDKNGKPIYTDATISFLQDLLKNTLPNEWEATPKSSSSAAYNLFYIMGTKLYNDDCQYVGPTADATKDLAQVLREKIAGRDGTLEDTKAKVEAGGLNVPTDVESYYDAAYYLLHNTWRDSAADATSNDGYGMPIAEYNRINLIQKVDSNGKKSYVFNSAYDNISYDTTTGVIQNTQLTTITPVQDNTITSTGYVRGNLIPENRFDPLNSMGYGKSGNTYADRGNRKDGWRNTYYANTNYHLSLEGHADFIYYQDANQYFTFTGDDDVYLYINGTRVLDVGAAHSISKVSINMNDVAKLCGLVDGQVYTFDFFYMERHGTAANFGIETNIQIVDPSMITTKTGYQNGVNTGYNGYVNPDVPVTYEFALENKGQEAIENLTFTDPRIGVTLTKDSIIMLENTVADLSLKLYNPDGTVKSDAAKGELTEDALKQYLTEGLAIGEKIVIDGFKHTILATEWETRQYQDADGNMVVSNE